MVNLAGFKDLSLLTLRHFPVSITFLDKVWEQFVGLPRFKWTVQVILYSLGLKWKSTYHPLHLVKHFPNSFCGISVCCPPQKTNLLTPVLFFTILYASHRGWLQDLLDSSLISILIPGKLSCVSANMSLCHIHLWLSLEKERRENIFVVFQRQTLTCTWNKYPPKHKMPRISTFDNATVPERLIVQ